MDYAIVQEFIDEGISGVKESRPALDLMMKMATQQKFKMVRFEYHARDYLTKSKPFLPLQFIFSLPRCFGIMSAKITRLSFGNISLNL